MTEPTYSIIRFFFKNGSEVIKTGLTLEEAQEWCKREDTHGDGWIDEKTPYWFDGYREE